MSETYDMGSNGSLEPDTHSETYSETYSAIYSGTHPEADSFVPGEDPEPDAAVTGEYLEAGIETAEPATDFSVESAPTELRFGALIGPYGETDDTWDEEYNYSTTTDSYIGEKSGREIDPWTGWEKT